MYIITPSKPGIFLIGIRENQLYGFGKKNKKLCIYQKSIFDSGDWEEFCVINVNVVKAECCENGLHVAAGINKTIIMIAARDEKFTHVFSINILTKQLFTCKMLYDDDVEFTPRNLCSKCLMPVIRSVSFSLGIFRFLITPRRFKFTEICQYDLIMSSHYSAIIKRGNISFDHNPSSSIAFNVDDRVLSVYGRSKGDGRIKSFVVNDDDDNERILYIPNNNIISVWHDMTFYTGSIGKTFALTRRKNAHNVTLRLYLVQFPELDIIDMTSFQFIASYTVDFNFPAFESSPFLLSYRDKMFEPDFIVFQTSVGIVTVPLRMLTLSESAYLSLRQIPEPPLPLEVKLSVFQRIRSLLRRKSKKEKVKEKWMSLNFIKKTLGLSNNFQLR